MKFGTITMQCSFSHGTRCAGEIAGKANNKDCGVGIAHDCNIGGKIDHVTCNHLFYSSLCPAFYYNWFFEYMKNMEVNNTQYSVHNNPHPPPKYLYFFI